MSTAASSLSARHALALRIATAARAGIATVVPSYAAIVFGWQPLLWAALGGWLGALGDPGGMPRPRLAAVGALAVGGGVVVALGLVTALMPVLAAAVLAIVVFGACLMRARGVVWRSVGTVLAVTAAIATSLPTSTKPAMAGLMFAFGASWPLLLSSLVWGGPPAPRLEPAPPIPHDVVVRHGACVVIAALVAFAVGRVLSPDHVSWVTVTTVAVLQPYPTATVERAVERAMGTIAGCLAVIAITWLVRGPLALGAVMFAFATASMLARIRSYRLFVVFLTPVFVLVADRMYAEWSLVATRILDVAAGGALAILATLVEHELARIEARRSVR